MFESCQNEWARSSCYHGLGQMASSIQQLLKIGNVPWSSPKNQLFIIPCEHYWKCRPNEMCRKTYFWWSSNKKWMNSCFTLTHC
jgi:hypothetical protein